MADLWEARDAAEDTPMRWRRVYTRDVRFITRVMEEVHQRVSAKDWLVFGKTFLLVQSMVGSVDG